jgi:hypothetical protein
VSQWDWRASPLIDEDIKREIPIGASLFYHDVIELQLVKLLRQLLAERSAC